MTMFLLAIGAYVIGHYLGRKSVLADLASHCSCCKELD